MDTVLMRFRSPSDEILAALGDVIAGLEICSPARFAEPYYIEADAIRGDLEAVLGRLTTDLRQDFDENERECGTWNGSFDYLVQLSSFIDGAVEVKTRLYSTADPSQGDIFYSRIVERVDANDFLLWVDSEDPV